MQLDADKDDRITTLGIRESESEASDVFRSKQVNNGESDRGYGKAARISSKLVSFAYKTDM